MSSVVQYFIAKLIKNKTHAWVFIIASPNIERLWHGIVCIDAPAIILMLNVFKRKFLSLLSMIRLKIYAARPITWLNQP